MNKKISVVINYRNDDYYEDCLSRISKSLNMNLYFLEKIGMKSLVDFNIVDWGSIKPLHDSVEVFSKFKENINFFYVEKKIADQLSVDQPNKFHLDKSPNLGFRMSKGEFILQTGCDQIISRSGWFNLLNLLKEKEKFSFDIDNTLFYIPRKKIDLEFYEKDPSIEIFERYINYSDFTAMKFKTPGFYLGGGYCLMCNRKIIEKLNGHTEVNIPGSANDLDFNTRIKKLGVDQVDCSGLGVNLFKFPSKLNSKRNLLLYKSKKTRFFPNLSKSIKPNDENWGLKNEKIEIKTPNKLIDTLIKSKDENFFINHEIDNKFSILKQLSLLSKFEDVSFDFKEWNLIFQLTKIIKLSRVFSLIEFGFENINRLNVIGKEHKSLEILSFDINCLKLNNNYTNRLLKVQNSLSNNRFAKFIALNSDNFEEFEKWIKKIKFERYANLYLINLSSVESNNLSIKIEEQIKEIKDYVSIIIFYNSKKNKNLYIPNISQNYKNIFSSKNTEIFINNDIENKNNYFEKIILKFNYLNYLSLSFIYSIYTIYNKTTFLLKKIHRSIFQFKY
tara:strand:- start:2711 stop:4387 length:1677 start_codon:yes stop_codon:yes gene_type:complete